MANFQIMNVRIKIKHDTETNWATSTLVPLKGEWCLDTTNNIIKIGDGTHTFANLPGICVGEADKLHTACTIAFEAQEADDSDLENPISAISTDVEGRFSFDGSQNISTQLTLVNITRTDATADNTATEVITGITSDTKGRITATNKMDAIAETTGSTDAGKLVKTNEDGQVDASLFLDGTNILNNEGIISAQYLTGEITSSNGTYVQATGTYVAGTTYYTDSTGTTIVDTTSFEEGVTDVSNYYVESSTDNTEVDMISKIETTDENNEITNIEYSQAYVLNAVNI